MTPVFIHGSRRRRHRCRRGTAATEFAILLPLLIVLCLAGADVSRFAACSMVLSSAARAGAERGAARRLTALNAGAWETDVKATVTAELANLPGYNPQESIVSVSTSPGNYELTVVRVETEHPFRTMVSWPFFPNPLSMHRRSVIREFR